jgi:hypothetical protein
MDLLLETDTRTCCRRPRGPVALWALLAVIGTVLTLAALGAATVADTRDFAARHGTVLGTRAL